MEHNFHEMPSMTQSITLLGVMDKLGNPPLLQILQRKPTQEEIQSLTSGHWNSHIALSTDYPIEGSSQIV